MPVQVVCRFSDFLEGLLIHLSWLCGEFVWVGLNLMIVLFLSMIWESYLDRLLAVGGTGSRKVVVDHIEVTLEGSEEFKEEFLSLGCPFGSALLDERFLMGLALLLETVIDDDVDARALRWNY
jgi:hypothetical protein